MRCRSSIPSWGLILLGLILWRPAMPTAQPTSDISGENGAAWDDVLSGLRDWTRPEVERVLDGPWRSVRTPHFRVHVQPGLAVDHTELAELEASFHDIADRLQLAEDRREDIRRRPIDYFHTRNRYLLRRFTEVDADGIAFAEFRIILSLRLPHAHEVAHVLLHEKTRPAAPATTPILLEGMATWLAGVGEAAAPVTAALGERRLAQGDVDLRQFLTVTTFRRSALDTHARYRCAARFCAFLVERWGVDEVLHLYRLLAGGAEEMLRRPTSAVVLQFEGWTGMSWEELLAEFDAWRADRPVGGIRLATAPTRAPDGRTAADGTRILWWREEDGRLVVSASTTDDEVDAELSWGEAPQRFRPDPDQPQWRRWGLRLAPDEIHLSDHHRRRRLAVLETGLDLAFFPPRSTVTVELDAAVVPALPEGGAVDLFVVPRFEISAP